MDRLSSSEGCSIESPANRVKHTTQLLSLDIRTGGRGRDRTDCRPHPIPFMEPVILGESDTSQLTCTCIRTLVSYNLWGVVARGQRDPLRCPGATHRSLTKLDTNGYQRKHIQHEILSCPFMLSSPVWLKFQNGSHAAINSRGAWLPGPTKLAPSYAATDTQMDAVRLRHFLAMAKAGSDQNGTVISVTSLLASG